MAAEFDMAPVEGEIEGQVGGLVPIEGARWLCDPRRGPGEFTAITDVGGLDPAPECP